MEFKSLNNIESSFRQIRLFGILFVCMCCAVMCYSVWKAYGFAELQREKIYVLDQGKSLMLALSQDLSQNRPVEAREHTRRFHELFFSLSPDKSAIEENIRRALFLADRSAYTRYRDLAEQGRDVVICSISMYTEVRAWNRENIEHYREVYLKVTPETLYRRDQKKLYSTKAKNVVGVDLPWDEPGHSSIVIQNDGQESPEEIVDRLMNFFGL